MCDDLVMAKLSSCLDNLPEEAKARYLMKISVIGGADPFLGVNSVTGSGACSQPPAVNTCDLVSYLVPKTIFITATQFKVRKRLEAYNQFIFGWVKDVTTGIREISHLCLSKILCILF